MQFHVILQLLPFRELFSAVFALAMLFLCVDSLVAPFRALITELLIAMTAAVWFTARVYPNMPY